MKWQIASWYQTIIGTFVWGIVWLKIEARGSQFLLQEKIVCQRLLQIAMNISSDCRQQQVLLVQLLKHQISVCLKNNRESKWSHCVYLCVYVYLWVILMLKLLLILGCEWTQGRTKLNSYSKNWINKWATQTLWMKHIYTVLSNHKYCIICITTIHENSKNSILFLYYLLIFNFVYLLSVLFSTQKYKSPW